MVKGMRLVGLALIISILISFSTPNNVVFSLDKSPAVKAAVTLPYLTHIVKAVGGDKVNVSALIPPGVDPHDYEPPYSQLIKALQSVDVVFMTGPSHLALEARIKELKSSGIFQGFVVDYTTYARFGLKLLANPKTGIPNPHGYLFSLNGLAAVAKAIAYTLSQIDPRDAEYYNARLKAYLYTLSSEEKTLKSALPPTRVILASPILQYAADDLGLNITYVILPDVSAEPTESDITTIKSLIIKNEADALLISDVIANRDPKLLNELNGLKLNIYIIPVSNLVDSPELIPAEIVTALHTRVMRSVAQPTPLTPSILLAGVLAEAVVIAALTILLYKWRKAVIEALCKEFRVRD